MTSAHLVTTEAARPAQRETLGRLVQLYLHMAEFFVLRRWRRTGVGRAAVRDLLERFPGTWEIRSSSTL